MDNKLFNVNGTSEYQFKLTLQLLLTDEYKEENENEMSWGRIGSGISGYKFTYEKGLILYWHFDEKSEPIDNILKDVDLSSKDLKKSLRKYKLDALDEKKKKRLSIPLDILTHALWQWFQNFNEYEKMKFEDWEEDADHDGSNNKGFRIYTERWGRIDGASSYTSEDYSAGAIKPVYCWYGK